MGMLDQDEEHLPPPLLWLPQIRCPVCEEKIRPEGHCDCQYGPGRAFYFCVCGYSFLADNWLPLWEAPPGVKGRSYKFNLKPKVVRQRIAVMAQFHRAQTRDAVHQSGAYHAIVHRCTLEESSASRRDLVSASGEDLSSLPFPNVPDRQLEEVFAEGIPAQQ